jgi:uncharacterized membrane protein YesL
VARELAEGRSTGVRGWIESGRKHLLPSLLWFVTNALAALVVVYNLLFYGQFSQTWSSYLRGVVGLLAIIWFCVQLYALPYYFMQEEKSLRLAWRNGFLTALASPFFSLIVFLVSFVLLIPSILFLLPAFMAIPGLVVVLGTEAVKDRVEVFRVREREEERARSESIHQGRG